MIPTEREYVVRGAYVLTMDPQLGDLPGGEVHVRDGVIMAVGEDLGLGLPVLDGSGTVLMPGLVDTHWHLWTTLHRALASSSPETAYIALNLRHGQSYGPEDMFQGTRLGLVEALSMGITTVHDWSHNLRTPGHADAVLRAHQEIGLRGRFSYGWRQGLPLTETIDLGDLARVGREWFAGDQLPLMHLGLAGRAPGTVAESVYRPEHEAALGLHLPVSYHVNSTRAQGSLEQIRLLHEASMLGPDTQLVHALYTTAAERDLVRDAGASVSISPWSELLIGFGVVPVHQLSVSGVLLTLSVDTLPLTGTGDLWSAMRLTLGLHRGQAENELSANARTVLHMATLGAAQGLGLQEVCGSIRPGKRADLVLVRTPTPDLHDVIDVPNLVVLTTERHCVDTVVVDGRVRRTGGRLLDVDTDQTSREAAQALGASLSRSR